MWVANNSGLDNQWNSVEEIREFFEFKDFPHFLKVFGTCVSYVTKESMFERIAYETLEDQTSQNVLHSEIIFSAPQRVKRAGMDFGFMMKAYNKGISRAEKDFNVTCSTRIDLIRDYGPDYCDAELGWIEDYPDGIVGIELGGSEHDWPPAQFKTVYERAREMGLRLVAHAGEAAGPESVIDAVNILGVERIGHGFTAKNSVEAIKLLKKKGVTIETCPISNVRTGVCGDIKDHPVRKYYDEGVSISVNSDDPTMFGTDMNNEYMTLHQVHGFTVSELYDISINSLKTSFLPEERIEKHLKDFQKRYERIIS
jgi:adenosine deaminase